MAFSCSNFLINFVLHPKIAITVGLNRRLLGTEKGREYDRGAVDRRDRNLIIILIGGTIETSLCFELKKKRPKAKAKKRRPEARDAGEAAVAFSSRNSGVLALSPACGGQSWRDIFFTRRRSSAVLCIKFLRAWDSDTRRRGERAGVARPV